MANRRQYLGLLPKLDPFDQVPLTNAVLLQPGDDIVQAASLRLGSGPLVEPAQAAAERVLALIEAEPEVRDADGVDASATHAAKTPAASSP